MKCSISAVRSALNKHPGTVPIYSPELQEWTCFLLALRKLFTRSAVMSELKRLQLLAIDDKLENLELISDACKRTIGDLNGERCPGWSRNLLACSTVRPRIVLLDLVMPRVSGMELLERIVGIDPGVDVSSHECCRRFWADHGQIGSYAQD